MKKAKRVRWPHLTLGAMTLLTVLFSLSTVFASVWDDLVDVKEIRYWSYPDYTRVVVDLSDKTQFSHNKLSNPDRLYFDIKNARISQDLSKAVTIDNGMLRSVRGAQFSKDTVRIVLDLEKIDTFKAFTLQEPDRLVIDVLGPVTVSSKMRIVLDPGHGGKDPGAVGVSKLYEKDVVLDIALKLKESLSKNPDIEVFLTRETDTFIPLEERTAIANGKNADLFVSIHANASTKPSLKGIETYFLNWTDDEEAMKVAARENAISLKQMKKMREKMNNDVLSIIMSDLSRDYKREKSMALANYLQKSMVGELGKNYDHVVDLGIKWSFFYVLFGAKMPSVLVEVSFVSNPLEAKLLKKDSYRNDLARSLALGIDRYMDSASEGQKVAQSRK